MGITIRLGTSEDAEAVVGLILELAEYERLEDEAAPDADAVRKHLDEAASPRVETLLAIDDESGAAIGFALFFPNYSTFLTKWGIYLEDLYVQPAYRGQGAGLALLRAVASIAVKRGCERLDWSVLKWNDLAINFYEGLGAAAMSDWQPMRLSGLDLVVFAAGGRPGQGVI